MIDKDKKSRKTLLIGTIIQNWDQIVRKDDKRKRLIKCDEIQAWLFAYLDFEIPLNEIKDLLIDARIKRKVIERQGYKRTRKNKKGSNSHLKENSKQKKVKTEVKGLFIYKHMSSKSNSK